MNPFKKEQEQFGYIVDHQQDEDPRNLYYSDLAPLGASDEVLPQSGGMSPEALRNLNQGHTGSCTCHSTVHAFSLLENIGLSPRYAFWKVKTDKKYRSSELPFGCYMVDSLKLLINEGIPKYDPLYDELDTGSDEAYLKAPRTYGPLMKGGAFIYVTSAGTNEEKWAQVQRYLAYESKPVKVGITWRTSFNDARKTGIVPAQPPTGKSVGHDMLATNYEERDGVLYIRFENSFGDQWGDHGAIWLPARYTVIQSAIAYIPPDETENIGIVKPEPVTERNVFLEKANADAVWKAVDAAFPRVGDLDANAKNTVARNLYAKTKLLIIQAITYNGYSVKDIVNWLNSHSRGKTQDKSYGWDFTKKRVK